MDVDFRGRHKAHDAPTVIQQMFQGLEERDLLAHGGDIVKSEHRQHEIIRTRLELTKVSVGYEAIFSQGVTGV